MILNRNGFYFFGYMPFTLCPQSLNTIKIKSEDSNITGFIVIMASFFMLLTIYFIRYTLYIS